jgi:hypothetical protein
MFRFVSLMLLAANLYAAEPAVDIDTAAKIYLEAAMREQVRASLPAMPAHIRQMFTGDVATPLTDQQMKIVTSAAERGFRIDVFEAPALNALAANLDASTVKKTEAFLASDLGQRMVSADVAVATLEEAKIDKIMSGEITAPTTAQRDALFDKLERAARSTESTVQVFLAMGQAVAVGTAVGSGMDTIAVEERARKSGDANRAGLMENMRKPLVRYMTYSYRDMSDADLKHLLVFLESPAGQRYVNAYTASQVAGFVAMGKRCGEQLGEGLRELAQAQLGPPPPDADSSASEPGPPDTPPAKP